MTPQNKKKPVNTTTTVLLTVYSTMSHRNVSCSCSLSTYPKKITVQKLLEWIFCSPKQKHG